MLVLSLVAWVFAFGALVSCVFSMIVVSMIKIIHGKKITGFFEILFCVCFVSVVIACFVLGPPLASNMFSRDETCDPCYGG